MEMPPRPKAWRPEKGSGVPPLIGVMLWLVVA
jgi:hypothetical protein